MSKIFYFIMNAFFLFNNTTNNSYLKNRELNNSEINYNYILKENERKLDEIIINLMII